MRPGCTVDGPLALDVACSPEACAIKGLDSPVGGAADCLVFPDIEADVDWTRGYEVLDKELPKLDIVYINAIAWVGDDYEELGSQYRLDKSSPLKPEAIILHPLARGVELSRNLDDTPHNWYFAQARGAVFIRMALLTCYVWLF